MSPDNQYSGENAKNYVNSQQKFYSQHQDDSRIEMFSLLDKPLKNKIILDAGCGSGQDVSHLQRLGANCYGIDREDMINIARLQHPNVNNFIVSDVSQTPFDDAFFDSIFSRYVLQYLDDIDEAYSEFHRILKPHGTLILLVAHPLLGFVAKKPEQRNYHKKEIIAIPIYDGNILVRWSSKTFGEYLSQFLLQHFNLEVLIEQSPENKSNENNFTETVPDYIIMKLRKK